MGTGWKRIACALDANFRVGVFKAAADGFAAEFTKMPVEPQNDREPWRADFHNLQQLENTSALGLNKEIQSSLVFVNRYQVGYSLWCQALLIFGFAAKRFYLLQVLHFFDI